MKREELADLIAFAAVAEERSFTRAAARQGVSQSALSQTVRRLEGRLGLRLLTRTTRSVAPTPAGERILETLAPALGNLERSIAELTDQQAQPSGTIRLNSVEHATEKYLRPAIRRIVTGYPDIAIEVVNDYAITDIVAGRFDAGIRLGEQVDKDMIAIRISPDIDMAVVGAPAYLETNPAPRDPRGLLKHRCINLWLPGSGVTYDWRFRGRGRTVKVRASGPLAFNSLAQIRHAALDGLGLALVPHDFVEEDITQGRLVPVLENRAQPLPGYHLYYPHRRYASPAFRLVVDALKLRNRG